MTLDYSEIAEFSDWQVKRVRARLLAFLRCQEREHDRHKGRIEGWDRKVDSAPDIVRRPTLMTVANEISVCPACEQWLYGEGEAENDLTDVPLEQINEYAPTDTGAEITERTLHGFVTGEARKNAQGDRYWHYTVPPSHKLNAITAFLVFKNFLSHTDLIDPSLEDIPEYVKAFFTELGIEKSAIPENHFFKGDFRNEKAIEGAVSIAFISIHTNKIQDAYLIRFVKKTYVRGSGESSTAFRQRIDFGRANNESRYFGWTYFSSDSPLIFLLVDEMDSDNVSAYGNIPYALLYINLVNNGRIEEQLVSDLLLHTSKLDPQANKVPEKIIWFQDKQEFEQAALTHTVQDDYAIFTKTYEKNLHKNIGTDMMGTDDNGSPEKRDRPSLAEKFLFKKKTISDDERFNVEAETESMPIEDVKRTIERISLLSADLPTETIDEQLYYAAYHGVGDLAAEVIVKGADVNYTCPQSGLRPIQIAAGHRAVFVIDELMKSDELDYLVKDKRGRLPSALAVEVADDTRLGSKLMEAEIRQAGERGIDYKTLLTNGNDETPEPGV